MTSFTNLTNTSISAEFAQNMRDAFAGFSFPKEEKAAKLRLTMSEVTELLAQGFVSPLNSEEKAVVEGSTEQKLLEMGGEVWGQEADNARIYIELDMFPGVFDVQVETNCTDEEAVELHKKGRLSSLAGNYVFVAWHGDKALHGWEARAAVTGRPFYCLNRGMFVNARFDAII